MHDLYKQGDLPYLNVKICPYCEHLVEKDKDECPNCSYSFGEKKIKSSTEDFKDVNEYVKDKQLDTEIQKIEEKIEEVEVKPFLQSKDNEESVIYCENCGAKMSLMQKYCGKCGNEVNKKTCPACHQVLDSSLSYCIYCGQKIANIEKSDEDVNHLIIQNPTEEENDLDSETLKTDEVKFNDVNEVIQKEIIPYKPHPVKKRIFTIFQLLVLAVVVFVMMFIPLFTKENLFTNIVDIMKGNIHDTITLKDFVQFGINSIKNSSFDLNSIKELLMGQNDGYIFTCYPFINFFFNDANVLLMISFVCIGVFYVAMTLSLLCMLFTSIIGWFRKKPLAGKSMKWVLISNTFGLICIYFNNLTNSFKGFDSWIIYSFVFVFVAWFIIKISSIRDVRLYKESKKGNRK